jgi:hypothetical protein
MRLRWGVELAAAQSPGPLQSHPKLQRTALAQGCLAHCEAPATFPAGQLLWAQGTCSATLKAAWKWLELACKAMRDKTLDKRPCVLFLWDS